MLNAAQRRRCADIAQTLDSGDLTVWRQARLTPDEEAYIWHLRRDHTGHYRLLRESGREYSAHSAIADVCRLQRPIETVTPSAAGGRGHKNNSHPKSGESYSERDLDYWATDDIDPDDDDPGDEMPVCGACKGSGKDRDGNQCQICGGRGRIPAEDQDDEEDDDDKEFEDE